MNSSDFYEVQYNFFRSLTSEEIEKAKTKDIKEGIKLKIDDYNKISDRSPYNILLMNVKSNVYTKFGYMCSIDIPDLFPDPCVYFDGWNVDIVSNRRYTGSDNRMFNGDLKIIFKRLVGDAVNETDIQIVSRACISFSLVLQYKQ